MSAGGSGGALRRSSRTDSPSNCRSGLWGKGEPKKMQCVYWIDSREVRAEAQSLI
jgi:hypothetical protein